jgi:hypothetical protein
VSLSQWHTDDEVWRNILYLYLYLFTFALHLHCVFYAFLIQAIAS